MFNEKPIISKWVADMYDQKVTETNDVEFLLSVIGQESKKILEVCCGSGRILVPLARAGHDVTGFDIDETMMDRIPSKSAEIKNVQWRKADAVHDDWGTGFDVVVLAGNILFNIVSNIEYKKAQELFIQKAADALLPGGYVYIGYSPFAPNGRTLTRPAGFSCEDDGSIVWSWEGTDDAGNYEKDSLTKGSFDEETGILKARRFSEIRLVSGKVIKEETERSMKHYATLEQIHEWLFNAGFVIEFEYEDFDKTPINDESQSVIIYARKYDLTQIRKRWWGCVYDQYYGSDVDDVNLMLDLIGAAPQNIFEPCCGTGRVLVQLAKAGHNVNGIDADEGMLARIPAKLDGVNNLKYTLANALTTDWGSNYDVVVLPCNTLMNIEHRDDDKAAQQLFIKKAASALKSGGHFFIAYDVYPYPAKFFSGESKLTDGRYAGTDDDGIVGRGYNCGGLYNPVTQIAVWNNHFEMTLPNGGKHIFPGHGHKYVCTRGEVHEWLKNAGFVIEEEFGGCDKRSFTGGPGWDIVWARKGG